MDKGGGGRGERKGKGGRERGEREGGKGGRERGGGWIKHSPIVVMPFQEVLHCFPIRQLLGTSDNGCDCGVGQGAGQGVGSEVQMARLRRTHSAAVEHSWHCGEGGDSHTPRGGGGGGREGGLLTFPGPFRWPCGGERTLPRPVRLTGCRVRVHMYSPACVSATPTFTVHCGHIHQGQYDHTHFPNMGHAHICPSSADWACGPCLRSGCGQTDWRPTPAMEGGSERAVLRDSGRGAPSWTAPVVT